MNSQMSSFCTSKRLHHGFLTSATMWQHLSSHRRHLGHTRKNSRAMPNTTYGTTPTFGDYVVTRGDHYGSTRTSRKVLDCGLYCPTIFRDAHHFVSTCERCQKAGMVMN
ncbi:hypothetical protein CR513_05164, partial [Mucuna pruriens]